MLVNWNPDVHGMCLLGGIHLRHIKSFVDGSFKFLDVGNILSCLPRIKSLFKPAFLFQDFETLLTSQELGHKRISFSMLVIQDVGINLQ